MKKKQKTESQSSGPRIGKKKWCDRYNLKKKDVSQSSIGFVDYEKVVRLVSWNYDVFNDVMFLFHVLIAMHEKRV